MGRRGPLVWVRQERGTPGVWAAAAQVAAMCTSSPAQHRGQPRRAPAACGNGLLVSERGSRSTLWPVSRPPGEATAWGPAQLQTVPKAAGPDPARKVQTVCAPAPDAGSGRPQPVGASLRLIADSAWYGVAPGQVRPAAAIGTALHRPSCGRAAMQPCSHAAGGATSGQGAAGSEQCQGHVSATATAVGGSGNAAAGNQSSRSSRAQMPSFSRLTGKRVAAV